MKHPNIVFVFADQMRASALGCLGIENVKTPNLDRLAKEGTLFTRAISNYPVCCPARATLLTGLHSQNHGLVTNDQQLRTDLPTIAHHLNSGGYRCGYIGKWHVDCVDRGVYIPPGPRRRGFDDLWAVNNCNHAYMNGYYYLNEYRDPIWIEGYEPDAQTDIAVDYIEKKTQGNDPFCLFLSWGPPHCPYKEVPQEYLDMYPPEEIELKPNAVGTADKSVIAGYYAHITALDDCMGRILEAIDRCSIRDNTIVIFTSDHGDMLFSHNHGWKMKPWAESVNIPFIVRWPHRIPAGRFCGSPIGLVDIMPTLLGLSGLEIPDDVDGSDLSQLFMGEASNGPKSQFIYNIIGYKGWSDGYNEWRGVVTESHTYVRLRDRAWLLFHDEKDPYQLNNLIDDDNYTGLKEALEEELQKHLDAVNDPFPSSDEAIEKYVVGKVIVSDDKEELIPSIISEYRNVHLSDPDADGIAAFIPFHPDERRFVRFFENQKIIKGKKGVERKLFHRDFFNREL